MSKVLENLKYSKTHEWLKVEGENAVVGITDYAQHHLGEVVFVDLPAVGDAFGKDEEFGAVESVKAASDLNLPVSGEIIAINEELEDNPNNVNVDCYANFIVKIKMENPDEVDELMNADEYTKYCEVKK